MNDLSVHAAAHSDVIYVVATTFSGTEAALRFARALAQKRRARLVLLVPQIARQRPTLDRAPLAKPWAVARYERMTRAFGQPIQVLPCAAASEAAAARQLMPACAVAILGGRHRWWWPHHEERIAAALRRSGCHVAYIPETADMLPLLSALDEPR